MPDPAVLADVASLVERHADALRSDVAIVARDAATCAWDGAAARRFHRHAVSLLYQLRVAADLLDRTVETLRRAAR